MRLHSQRPRAVWLWLALLLAACSQSTASKLDLTPPELKQAARVVEYLLEPRHLSRSAFSVAFPECRPSQFVSFMFSTMGTAEWPDSEAMAEQDPMLREQAEAIRAPLRPKGVAIIAREPNPASGQQIVVKADDARGVVIVEGYTDPKLQPILTREYKVPRVTAGPGVRAIFESNRDLGRPHRKD
jgi:hypothetical protein